MNDYCPANNTVFALTAYGDIANHEAECGNTVGIKIEIAQVTRVPLRSIRSAVFMPRRVKVTASAHAFGVAAIPFFVNMKSLQTFAVPGDCSGHANNVGTTLREGDFALDG